MYVKKGGKDKTNEYTIIIPGVSGYVLEFQTRSQIYSKKSFISSIGFVNGCGNASKKLDKAPC